MSYSYVKTVFPDFKYSNVYNTKLYDTNDTNDKNTLKIIPAEQHNNAFAELNEGKKSNIETFENNLKFFNIPLDPTKNNINNTNDNLLSNPVNAVHTGNPVNTGNAVNPVNAVNAVNPVNAVSNNMNSLRSENGDGTHIEYTTHILECSSCKQLLMKQLNIDNDRIKSEEIMELISFMMFGVFILLLLDNIRG